MAFRDHFEGFENEDRFRMVFFQARGDCPVLMDRTVKRIIAHFAPEFTDKLFEVRQCKRRLQYVGCGCAYFDWIKDDVLVKSRILDGKVKSSKSRRANLEECSVLSST